MVKTVNHQPDMFNACRALTTCGRISRQISSSARYLQGGREELRPENRRDNGNVQDGNGNPPKDRTAKRTVPSGKLT